jgi:DivIVA domain-containing protein
VTPEQIESAAFSTVKRGGYRTEEVDRFLRSIAEEYRALHVRVREAEGANVDLEAAGAEMASLLRDVHAQVGERRRLAEAEAEQLRRDAEIEAAKILAAATEQADTIRQQADRVLGDAQHHAELLRSDGEQRVREQAGEVLRSARTELQALVRRKHDMAAALSSLRSDLAAMESTLDAAALSPDALGDDVIDQTLIDLRESQRVPAQAASPAPAHPSTAATSSIFTPPDQSPN